MAVAARGDDAGADRGIEIGGADAEALEHAVAKPAAGFVGAVDEQQMVARLDEGLLADRVDGGELLLGRERPGADAVTVEMAALKHRLPVPAEGAALAEEAQSLGCTRAERRIARRDS